MHAQDRKYGYDWIPDRVLQAAVNSVRDRPASSADGGALLALLNTMQVCIARARPRARACALALPTPT